MSDLTMQQTTAPTPALGDVHRLDEIARLRAEVATLEAEQITDWNDPRLSDLLSTAEEAAADHGNLHEWTVLADHFGHVAEARPWTVFADFTARLAIHVPSARTREEAEEEASNVEHIRAAVTRYLSLREQGGITVVSITPDSRDQED